MKSFFDDEDDQDEMQYQMHLEWTRQEIEKSKQEELIEVLNSFRDIIDEFETSDEPWYEIRLGRCVLYLKR